MSSTNGLHRMPTTEEIREKIENIDHEWHRYAFMYQYLVAGRISEVCGEYAPIGTDAIEVDIEVDGKWVPAVLFAVKTAKRKGRLRPCLLPLEKEYEPWARPLLNYFKKAGRDKPFSFAMRTSHYHAVNVFDGMMWPFKEYSHNGIKIPARWKPFRSHELRKARTHEIKRKYGFDVLDIALYGGWTSQATDARTPSVLEHYLYLDITSVEDNIDLLLDLGETYFDKLLNPRKTRTTRRVYGRRRPDSTKGGLK